MLSRSFGAFIKWIDDPIFSRAVTLTDTSFGGRDYARLELVRRENARRGRVEGLEASFRQQFRFLPGALSGLGIEANLALIDSSCHRPVSSSSLKQQLNELSAG